MTQFDTTVTAAAAVVESATKDRHRASAVLRTNTHTGGSRRAEPKLIATIGYTSAAYEISFSLSLSLSHSLSLSLSHSLSLSLSHSLSLSLSPQQLTPFSSAG